MSNDHKSTSSVSSNLRRLPGFLYRSIFTERIRSSPLFWRIKSAILGHDRIYDSHYFRDGVEPAAARSSELIAATIIREWHPNSVVDVGCGTGAILAAFAEEGCSVLGLELAEAAIGICRERGLDVHKFDLESDSPETDWRFDCALCLEVAEHLPKRTADRLVDILTGLSLTVVFSAAPPGQLGVDHVNLQPPSWWINKFEKRGFDFLEEQTHAWRKQWKNSGRVQHWYFQNLLIFRRNTQQFVTHR